MDCIEDDIRYHLKRGPLRPSTLLQVLKDRGWDEKNAQRAMRNVLDRGLVRLNLEMEVELAV